MNSHLRNKLFQFPRGYHPVSSAALVFFFLLIFSSTQSYAQYEIGSTSRGIEITPFAGFQFGGRLDVAEGSLNIIDTEHYGVMIDLPIEYSTQLEFFYSYQPTELEIEEYGPFAEKMRVFDMTVEYWHIGVVRGLKRGNIMPFGSFSVGLANFNPKKSGIDSVQRFSVAMGVGVKAYMNERIGFRFQSRLLFPIQWAGGSLFCGTDGCSFGVGASTAIVQLDLTGGLIISF
jgi:hypothetical protein